MTDIYQQLLGAGTAVVSDVFDTLGLVPPILDTSLFAVKGTGMGSRVLPILSLVRITSGPEAATALSWERSTPCRLALLLCGPAMVSKASAVLEIYWPAPCKHGESSEL